MMSKPSLPVAPTALRAALAQAVEAQGLVLLGIVALQPEPRYPDFQAWLADGKHAGMQFLTEHGHCRADPRELLPGAQSAIVMGLPYYAGDRWQARPPADEPPRIAQYARLSDYHRSLRRKGEAVLAWLQEQEQAGQKADGRLVVDSAPVLERALAARTAEGFIGKNTLYIHPQHGSFLLLAELLSTMALPPDEPATVDPGRRSPKGGCGSCRRCQVHCPTGALNRDYTIDARLCLAYYSIEHRGPVPVQFWPWFATYFFGCDICQLVCPYNRGVATIKAEELRVRGLPPLAELALLSQARYEELFGGTPLTRAKRHGLRRNALIGMVVRNDEALAEVLASLAADPHELLTATIAQIPSYHAMRQEQAAPAAKPAIIEAKLQPS